jgi:hypothetical protein
LRRRHVGFVGKGAVRPPGLQRTEKKKMTTLAKDSVHFVVDPTSEDEATVHVESDGLPVTGYQVSWRGFLHAGDKGQPSAVRFLAAHAPERVRSLVRRAALTGRTFHLNRTVVARTDLLEAFGLDAAPRLMAA